jgi:signal transduction histidine kinase
MKKFSIENQTLLVALIPILVMAILLENYLVYSRFSDLEDALLERSNLMVHELASSSEYAVFSNNIALLQHNVDEALTRHDVSRVVVLDALANPLMGGGWSGQYEALLKNASTYQNDEFLILREPILSTQINLNDLDHESGLTQINAKPLGTVIIEISKQRLTGQKRTILLYSFAITGIILLVSLLLALWVGRRITRPIRGMSHAINRFGEGALDTRIALQSEVLELNDLAAGFNRMAQKLQLSQETLETRVAERTAALATSEQESRTLIENTPDTIARYDRNLRRSYINPAFRAMMPDGNNALLGKKPSEAPGGADAIRYEASLNEVFESGVNRHFELIWLGIDGVAHSSDIQLTAERDSSGIIISVLAVGRDITELNRSKDEIKRKELAKSQFLAAAGHDLRQPLAAANLFIDALRYTEPTVKQNQIITRLDQAMCTFNNLLDALLNISKLDAGIIKPKYASINVIEIISWLEQSYAPIALKKKLGFKLYFSMKEALVIHSDIDLLKSVLMNLVSNALKYCATGAILVSARRRNEEILFQVWDTGMGIKPENIPQIYDEFYQINNPQRDRSSGIGLGLAIAKRAISLLESNIECRSMFGRGSVFSFRLPLDKSQSTLVSGAEAAPENMALASFAPGKHFVVVEDDVMVAEALCDALVMMGGEVQCFHNAEDALNNALRADYYISDYMLGGELNGIQLLNQLHKKHGIKAVLMTGDTSVSFIKETGNCVWPVLHKPVNMAKLIAELNIQ